MDLESEQNAVLEKLSSYQHHHPEFRPEWRKQGMDLPLANNRFGFVQHAVVCDSQGVAQYDQPMFTCPSGPVCLVVDQDDRLALLQLKRVVMTERSVNAGAAIDDVSICGSVSLECPRGGAEGRETLADAAVRETEEETGFLVTKVEPMDEVNGDTAFFPFSHQVFLVTVDSTRKSGRRADAFEDVTVKLVELCDVVKRVAEGEIRCGLTKAAIATYVCRLIRHGDIQRLSGE